VCGGIKWVSFESTICRIVTEEGDKQRFATIVEPHLGEALTLARWLTGSRTDAQDVVQEACLRAFRAISSYGGGSSRSWVLTIVRNTAYTWLGKARQTRFVAMDDLKEDERLQMESGGIAESETASTPETELIAQADADRLTKAIDALPTEFREALVLRDLQGLDYREIASVTAVPLGTVMSRLARARRRLIHTLRTTE
jgi:RNA polymerase sigma-70 factor, ECF subfamily